jgi:hypothetical protein
LLFLLEILAHRFQFTAFLLDLLFDLVHLTPFAIDAVADLLELLAFLLEFAAFLLERLSLVLDLLRQCLGEGLAIGSRRRIVLERRLLGSIASVALEPADAPGRFAGGLLAVGEVLELTGTDDDFEIADVVGHDLWIGCQRLE